MAFSPDAWLIVARACAAPDPECSEPEAWYRSAVNRAYYAPLMAIAARVVASQGESVFAGDRTHTQIKAALQRQRDVPVIRRLRDQLRNVENLRDRADYVLSWGCVRDDADDALQRGERLVQLINRLPAEVFAKLPVR